MNHIEADLQISSLEAPSKPSIPAMESRKRLVVVIFDVEQEALLASRILDLIQPGSLSVLLLGVAKDSLDEGELRRKLITIAAFLQGAWQANRNKAPFQSEIQVERERDWLRKVGSALRPSDLLACCGEQKFGSRQRPLSDVLSSSFNVTVYAFAGLRESRPGRRQMLLQLLPWLGSLTSIGGFLWLQIQIIAAVQGGLQQILLILTLFAEVGVLWFVNSLFAAS